jgi:hypothetical protein
MTFALILAFPPEGSIKTESQIKHFTIEDALPNITCSFWHLLQRTFTNLLFIKMRKETGL